MTLNINTRLNLPLLAICLVSFLTFGRAHAEAPKVIVSIKPVHSWVSAVMQGVATPDLIIDDNGSVHGYSLRPSHAGLLQQADLVVWVGPDLENFLPRALENLAPDSRQLRIDDIQGIKLLAMREGGDFEAHDHDHDHDHDHNHDGHASESHHQHDHGHIDMHLWLDPQNAIVATQAIAQTLSEMDPENGDLYQSNAAAYGEQLRQQMAQIESQLTPVRGKAFIVFHDAYQYFESRFNVPASGSITINPEQAPGAARISAIRDKINRLSGVCVFSEPQFEPRLIRTVIEGSDAHTGVLDPLGADITAGPNQYLTLLGNLSESLYQCLNNES